MVSIMRPTCISSSISALIWSTASMLRIRLCSHIRPQQQKANQTHSRRRTLFSESMGTDLDGGVEDERVADERADLVSPAAARPTPVLPDRPQVLPPAVVLVVHRQPRVQVLRLQLVVDRVVVEGLYLHSLE